MHPMLNTAVKAARRAGRSCAASQLDRLTVEKQGNDFVSQVDREAEAGIIDVLKRAYRITPFSRRKRAAG
jgi:myo-inositol-1(or 4)-monophosphatase